MYRITTIGNNGKQQELYSDYKAAYIKYLIYADDYQQKTTLEEIDTEELIKVIENIDFRKLEEN